MSTDFFKTSCQNRTTEKKFGLYDSDDETPAKIKFTDQQSWNAIVINQEGRTVLFTAIDYCIDFFKDNGNMDSRCDCMLTYDSTLLLVELKNKRGSWQSEGLSQIENVASRMLDEIPNFYYGFKKRKAVVANRKNKFPAFQESNSEMRQYFRSKFKMYVLFEAEIKIE